jgi:hypothetical protein
MSVLFRPGVYLVEPGVYGNESVVHLLVEGVEPLVGPPLSWRHHHHEPSVTL